MKYFTLVSLFLLFSGLHSLLGVEKDEFKEQIEDKKIPAILKLADGKRPDLLPILSTFVKKGNLSVELETAIVQVYNQLDKQLPVLYPNYHEDLEEIIDTSKNEEIVLLSLSIIQNLKEKKVIYSILDLVTNRNSQIRRAAYQILNTYKDDRVLPPILELGNSEEPIKRYYYLEALNFIQDERVNVHVQKLLYDPSPAIRSEAIVVIEKLNLKDKLNQVLAMATVDTNYEVRKTAVVSLKNQKSKFPTTVYQKTIFDSNLEVRDVSVDAIQNTKDSSYGKFISIALEKEIHSFLRSKMIDTLLLLNNHGGGQGLSVSLRKDADVEVRRKSAYAIGILKATIAIPDLVRSLKLEKELTVKLESTKSLGLLKEKSAIPTILGQFQANEPEPLRLEFLTTLDKIDDPVVMPILFDLIDPETQETVKVSIKSVLRKMLYRYHGGSKATKVLALVNTQE
jgi:HEAT repeat protein